MGVLNKNGALYFASGIDNSGLKKDSEEAKRYLQDISDFAKGAGAVLGTAFSVGMLKNFGDQIVNVRGEIQMLESSFEVLLGNRRDADAMLAEIKQYAIESPLSLSGVSNAAQTLLSFNIAAKDVIPVMKQIGDISMGNEQRFQSLILAFSQMSSTGKLMGQDLLQMINAGFNPLSVMAEKTGKSIGELKKEMESGAISSEMVADAFRMATEEGGKFYGMTQKQAEGIKGMQAQLQGAWEENFNNIGKNNEEIIAGMYKAGLSIAENYEKIGRVIASLIATYGAYKAALIVVTTAESGYTLAQMTKYRWLLMVEKAQRLLNATMLKNPYVAVTVLVVGLVSAMIALRDRTSMMEKAQKQLNAVLDEAKDKKEALRNKGNELISILTSETATVYQQIKAYKELLAMLPQLKGKSLDDIKKMNPEDIQAMIAEREDSVEAETVKARYEERIKNIEGYRAKIKELQKSGADNATISYYRNELGKALAETKVFKAQLDEMAAIQKEAFYQENPEAKRKDLQLQRINLLQKEKELTEKIGKAQNDFESANDRLQLNAIKSTIKGVEESLASLDKSTDKSTIKNHAYWEKIKDDAEKARKALGTDQEGSKEWGELTKKINEANAELKKYSDKEAGATQTNQVGDAQRKLVEQRKKNAIEEKRLIEDLDNEMSRAKIEAMSDGFDKTMKLRELNHKVEMQNLERQKEDYISHITQARREEFEAEEEIKAKKNKNYVKKTFDTGTVDVNTSAYDNIITQKNTQYVNDTKKSWNDLALEFGDYYQKRLAIAEKWEKEIAELPAQFQAGARIKMNAELANLDDEYKKTTSSITELFKDTSEKTSAELRKIADEAERMKDFVLGGQWDAGDGADFGITEAQFKSLNEEWSKSPEKLEAIIKAIKELKREADLKENTFKSIGRAVEAIFSPDTSGKDRKKAWSDLATGIGEVNGMLTSVGDNISSVFSALGNENAAELAGNITHLIGGVGELGAGIAQLGSGDIIGGIKSLSSGISNVVTSIFRMGDAAKEKKIRRLQDQIDSLKKSYDDLDDAIGKAYSKDAANLIEQNNALLRQQQIAIEQQIKQEEQKKKTDKNKIKEWYNELEAIDKKIADNKVKAVDAIYGEDIQSAIDRFAQAYIDMWAAGDDKAKSRKDFVKNMIKSMIMEAMKSDISKPMEAIRKQMDAFWSDGRITDAEANIIDSMVEDLQNQLDRKYSWADKYIQDKTSSGVTGELKAEMTEQTGSQLVGLWNMTAMDIRAIREHYEKNPTQDVAKELNNLLNELQAIRANTGRTADNTDNLDDGIKALKYLLEEIKKNTKPNNSRL